MLAGNLDLAFDEIAVLRLVGAGERRDEVLPALLFVKQIALLIGD